MAIIGAHMLLYTREPEALRAVLRDVFGFNYVDTGGGWLIFALPPSELGVHPLEGALPPSGAPHQVSFMCDNLDTTIRELRAHGIEVNGEPVTQQWGTTMLIELPGGCRVLIYEPGHPLAITQSSPGESPS